MHQKSLIIFKVFTFALGLPFLLSPCLFLLLLLSLFPCLPHDLSQPAAVGGVVESHLTCCCQTESQSHYKQKSISEIEQPSHHEF